MIVTASKVTIEEVLNTLIETGNEAQHCARVRDYLSRTNSDIKKN